MKKLTFYLAAVLVITAALTSCSSEKEEGDTVIIKNEFVTAVSGPATGNTNQEIIFQVTYNVDSSCATFSQYIQTTSSNLKTIEVQVKYLGDCSPSPATATQPYKFVVIQPGTYTFKFKSGPSAYITKTVAVQ
ncbi:MAG TPA: hypothetical protein VFR70_07115 [Flavobacterium sp.]|nr:hypothetical protein [Flavobacterium sp.]